MESWPEHAPILKNPLSFPAVIVYDSSSPSSASSATTGVPTGDPETTPSTTSKEYREAGNAGTSFSSFTAIVRSHSRNDEAVSSATSFTVYCEHVSKSNDTPVFNCNSPTVPICGHRVLRDATRVKAYWR